jgi:hypothetical protein
MMPNPLLLWTAGQRGVGATVTSACRGAVS